MAATYREVGADASEILSSIHMQSFDSGWPAHAFLGFFERNNLLACLAESDGKPVGFCLAWVVGGDCELLSLAVLEEHRRSGIGRELLQRAIDFARSKGASQMVLEVNIRNEAAQRMYLQEGFFIQSRRKDYYKNSDGSRDDALTMCRKLQSHEQIPLVI